jgi:thioesterase domain-containing protein
MTCAELERHLHDTIPLARAMSLRIAGYEGGVLRMTAPLAPNVNDKGCAFGGSLASLMTLAAWSTVFLRLGDAGKGAEIYVQDSELRYLAPVWDDIVVEARLQVEDGGDGLQASYASRGKARVTAEAHCRCADGSLATSMLARFVAIDPARRMPR